MSTSTPNDYLARIAAERRIQLVVNNGGGGIAADWNFALSLSTTEWTTLAHQDDWYEPEYTEQSLDACEGVHDVLIVFTAANERLHGRPGLRGNQTAKRLLCTLAFGSASVIHTRFRKRLLLSFGNPIPCPAVTFHRRAIDNFEFPEGWKSNLDWVAWLDLAARPGSFVYVSRPLVHRTLHADAATSIWIADRGHEDSRILRQLWPRPVSDVLAWGYGASRLPYWLLKRRPPGWTGE